MSLRTSNDADTKDSPALVVAVGSETSTLQDDEVQKHLYGFLDQLGPQDDVFLLPPDQTRLHSQAGKITEMIARYYKFIGVEGKDETGSGDKDEKETDEGQPSVPQIQIMPALGTHQPMTKEQIASMFGPELAAKDPSPFLVHDWRNDVVTIGHAPAEMVSRATRGMISEPWPAQLNKLVWEKRRSANKQGKRRVVISIGQVVPHEVMGMANFNKNIFIGVGGTEAIDLSHGIGAIYGMENMMGKSDNPLRSILNYASEKFLGELDIWYVLTVMADNPNTKQVEMRGLYIGNDIECYNEACKLSIATNITMLDKAPKKIVAYLDPREFHSTWVANKAIYRTRMAVADGGELIILAPGVKRFGEGDRVDNLIRKYGYSGTPAIMKAIEENQELKDSLGAAAHLIHGSSEGRFQITYCPGHLTKDEIEKVGFQYADLEEMSKIYDIESLKDGWNRSPDTDEEFFFIRNPALGLWALRSKFESSS